MLGDEIAENGGLGGGGFLRGGGCEGVGGVVVGGCDVGGCGGLPGGGAGRKEGDGKDGGKGYGQYADGIGDAALGAWGGEEGAHEQCDTGTRYELVVVCCFHFV